MIYNKEKDLAGSTGSFLCFSLYQELTNDGLNDFPQGFRRVHMQPPAGAQSYSGGGKEIKRGGKNYTNNKDKLTQGRYPSSFKI